MSQQGVAAANEHFVKEEKKESSRLRESSGFIDDALGPFPNASSSSPEVVKKNSKASTGKRKYHQKSRSGCSTCKKRRVKCDEQKPLCGNCVKLKLECGYLYMDPDEDAPPVKKPKWSRQSQNQR